MRNQSARVFALACVLAALTPIAMPSPRPVEHTGFPGWPSNFDGKALQPIALAPVEQRFAESFPGRIGRFSDGQREVVIRWISAPTRKLHAASDCFRGSGYRVKPLPLQRANGMWGAFSAERGTLRLYVREVIIDASGQRWTDVSAWYWAAVRGETQAPWWAITVAAGTDEVAMSNVPLASAE